MAYITFMSVLQTYKLSHFLSSQLSCEQDNTLPKATSVNFRPEQGLWTQLSQIPIQKAAVMVTAEYCTAVSQGCSKQSHMNATERGEPFFCFIKHSQKRQSLAQVSPVGTAYFESLVLRKPHSNSQRNKPPQFLTSKSKNRNSVWNVDILDQF